MTRIAELEAMCDEMMKLSYDGAINIGEDDMEKWKDKVSALLGKKVNR